ncbi:proteoglycan 4 [Ceratobasidium sp. AG-Ba]|nr:proteoglycan 4 [Ceratobasidium sp. AG-Ba]
MDKRPLSAIFLGSHSGALGSLTPTALQVATGTNHHIGSSGLPSPPATNSTASTGKESVPKRVRKTSLAFATVKSLLSGDKREHDKARMRRDSDDVDDQPFEDEDHTARLSGPTASTSSGGSLVLGRSHSTTSSGGVERKNLADRNRKVLDKLSSISSAASSRLNSPAPNDRIPLTASTLKSRALSPMPPISNNTLFPPKSNTSASGSSPRNGPIPLASPNIRQARDLEPETPSTGSRAGSNGGSSGQGSDSQRRMSGVPRQTSIRDAPRVQEIEFKTEPEQSTTPKERERLYESQRAPAPVFVVGGEGSASGTRRDGSVRVSFSGSRQDADLEAVVGNGRVPRQRVYSSESDDRSITPPADPYSRRHVTDPVPPTTPGLRREQRISINEPGASPIKEREPLRTRTTAGTIGRGRNSSEAVIERTVAAARKSPVRARGALPSEFRSGTESKRALVDSKRMSLDGKRTFSRSSNSPEFLRRDSALTRPSTAGGSRSATVREPRRTGMHSRWASEDTSGDMTESPRPRYERRGGSIESPIALGGRSVVSESFRAAGLTRRRDDDEEPPLSASTTRTAGTRGSLDWDVQQLREGIARVGVGDTSIGEEDDDRDDDLRTPPAHKRAASRNIHQIDTTSRPGTSNGDHDDAPRTAPPALRTYRSLNTGLITPSNSGTIRDRGATPVTPANLVSAAATEHVRLMLESFAMFESNLARLENNSGAVPELLQNADIVVQTSQNLNSLLRRSAANAVAQQIEAEVEDRNESELEIWKATGAEFRDALKVCDELVRSMTHLLLGVGRVLKDAEGRGGVSSGRMSADGVRTGRMSADGLRSGRMSADGFRARVGENRILEERRLSGVEVRRSLDADPIRRIGSHELPRLYDPMRPQTSMSLLREREQVRSPTSDSSSRRLPSESRRVFPRAESPAMANEADTSYDTDVYPSPSPAARQHGRERVLSIPPRLETVPSESIVRKGTISRRPRINVSTIRGGLPFTTASPAPASTHISTATASGNSSPEKPQRSMSYSVSRKAGAAISRAGVDALAGLSSQARKRTISAADPLEPEEEPAGRSTITRGRPSMDFNTSADESSASGTERRPRRRMATELFT